MQITAAMVGGQPRNCARFFAQARNCARAAERPTELPSEISKRHWLLSELGCSIIAMQL